MNEIHHFKSVLNTGHCIFYDSFGPKCLFTLNHDLFTYQDHTVVLLSSTFHSNHFCSNLFKC